MVESAYDEKRAKSYQRIKQRLSLFNLVWTPLLLAVIAFSPLTDLFYDGAAALSQNRYLTVLLYFAFFSVFLLLIDIPLTYYSGFVLEHRYGLSNQTRGQWLSFFAKKSLLSFALAAALVTALYGVIWRYPDRWWVFAWVIYAGVSYVLGKIFPVWIVPLFYRYDRIGEGEVRDRILRLTRQYGLPVENLYSLNLSKTTKKANAAFMGLGKTKRVVLSDTLIENFSPSEIETVVAHELGHYKHRDIFKQLAFGLFSTFVGFWLVFRILGWMTAVLDVAGPGAIEAMPLLFLSFYLFSVVWMPLQSAFSRALERAADRFALEACPRVDVFVSCMEKLGRVNFADPSPHPVYEWFFYDHPAIYRRIRMARQWETRS